MKIRITALIGLLAAVAIVAAGPGAGATTPTTQCARAANYPAATTPIAFWSTEARCAIVPAGPGGIFGIENFGNKFPGEAAVYMGIVHVAIYDAAVAIDGGYKPFLPTDAAPANTSPEAAIATAAYNTLSGLQPQLGADQTILDNDYTAYMAAMPDGTAKSNGIIVGRQVADSVVNWRTNDGRGCTTTLQVLNPPAPGPGVWQPNPTGPVLGLCLPGMRPLALQSASQFRPDGPNALTSQDYADDLNQVEQLGAANSTTRTPAQTEQALFWTDHDIRMWNDGLLRLAADQNLNLVQTARMLAMAHVAGGDAMIACFDAKYHYWFWRPYQAIHLADTDGNPTTIADPNWQPLRPTPNFPEYPSAHACHSTAVVTALEAFFGTNKIPVTLDSRVTHTTRSYDRLDDIVKDVDWARVLVGFHFRNSDLQGTALGRKVGRYVADNYFQPVG
ncbi:MAG TPA: hypothetical protein VJP41_00250 [Gaiellaceae bacterium]|nr:hypothetical protein [Gaiellaceae bacterium]